MPYKILVLLAFFVASLFIVAQRSTGRVTPSHRGSRSYRYVAVILPENECGSGLVCVSHGLFHHGDELITVRADRIAGAPRDADNVIQRRVMTHFLARSPNVGDSLLVVDVTRVKPCLHGTTFRKQLRRYALLPTGTRPDYLSLCRAGPNTVPAAYLVNQAMARLLVAGLPIRTPVYSSLPVFFELDDNDSFRDSGLKLCVISATREGHCALDDALGRHLVDGASVHAPGAEILTDPRVALAIIQYRVPALDATLLLRVASLVHGEPRRTYAITSKTGAPQAAVCVPSSVAFILSGQMPPDCIHTVVESLAE